jgi:hypothetical protein
VLCDWRDDGDISCAPVLFGAGIDSVTSTVCTGNHPVSGPQVFCDHFVRDGAVTRPARHRDGLRDSCPKRADVRSIDPIARRG